MNWFTHKTCIAARWIPRQIPLSKLQHRGANPIPSHRCIYIYIYTHKCICECKAQPTAPPMMHTEFTSDRKVLGRKGTKVSQFQSWSYPQLCHLPQRKKIFFFTKRASLLLIRFHFLYYIYHICNFHQGKTNHSLTTFFQKCWETDEYIVLTHLLNMNSGRAGQIHKLFLCPAFKHVLALSDMGRTLPHSKKKHRLKSPVSQKQPWYVSLRELGGTAKSPRTLLNYSNASRQKQPHRGGKKK